MVPPVLDLTSPPPSFSQLLCLFWQSDLAVIWIFCDAFGNFWHQFYVWENCVCSWFCQFIFLIIKLWGFWHPWRPTLPWRTPYRSRSGRHGLSSSWQVATAKFNPNSVTEKGNLSSHFLIWEFIHLWWLNTSSQDIAKNTKSEKLKYYIWKNIQSLQKTMKIRGLDTIFPKN